MKKLLLLLICGVCLFSCTPYDDVYYGDTLYIYNGYKVVNTLSVPRHTIIRHNRPLPPPPVVMPPYWSRHERVIIQRGPILKHGGHR